jgi:hypothetical protein
MTDDDDIQESISLTTPSDLIKTDDSVSPSQKEKGGKNGAEECHSTTGIRSTAASSMIQRKSPKVLHRSETEEETSGSTSGSSRRSDSATRRGATNNAACWPLVISSSAVLLLVIVGCGWTRFPSSRPAEDETALPVQVSSSSHSSKQSLLEAMHQRNHSTIIVDKRPSSKFSKTWNLTVEQQVLLEPMAAIFKVGTNFNATTSSTSVSVWHALYGLACQQATFGNVAPLVDYISSLDLYILSHGGIGSNALVDHLDQHSSLTVKIKDNSKSRNKKAKKKFYDYSCHLGNPVLVGLVRLPQQQQQHLLLPRIPPTLVIIGDFYNAFCSMKRRGWLNMNIAKNLYASQYCRTQWQYHLQQHGAATAGPFSTDPAGIKIMMLSHIFVASKNRTAAAAPRDKDSSSPIVFLQAPYNRESIVQALELLLLVSPPSSSLANENGIINNADNNNNTNNNNTNRIDVQKHIDGFEVRPRQQHYNHSNSSIGSNNSNLDDLHALYKPYIQLEDILSRMPRAWTAADTPHELYDYLLAEFQQ